MSIPPHRHSHYYRAVSNSISTAEVGILAPASSTVTAAMKSVAAVKTVTTMEAVAAGDEDAYFRSEITVWIRTIARIIIPFIIYGVGYTASQHKDNQCK